MGRTRVLLAAIVALAAGTGCNAVLGAGEPEVLNGNGVDIVDRDPAGAPGACGDGVINAELGESCDDENADTDDGCVECKIVCGPFPEVLDENTGHCYRFGGVPTMPEGMSNPVSMKDALPWSEAAGACDAWKGTLATITPTPTDDPDRSNYDELAFVQNVVMHQPPEIGLVNGFWLSGHRMNGSFLWETGEVLKDPSQEPAWAPGHPQGPPNDCVAFGNGSLAFESLDCAVMRPYLCERGVPGQPPVAEEPAAE